MKLLDHEDEQHKKFVILLLNECIRENEYHKEQLKQLSTIIWSKKRFSFILTFKKIYILMMIDNAKQNLKN